jgi:arylformamidase
MDTPSPDSSKGGLESPNHKLLLKNEIILIEYLCNLKRLKGPKIFIMALPLKIKGGDGSPARVVAYDMKV